MNVQPKSTDPFVSPLQAAGPSDKEAKPVADDEAALILKSLEETAEITDAIAVAAFKKDEPLHEITVTPAEFQKIEKAKIEDELKRYLKDPTCPLDFSKCVKSPSTITDCDFLHKLFRKVSSRELHAIVQALVLHCPHLTTLDFSYTRIKGDTIALLAPLAKLRHLNLSCCTKLYDAEIKPLASLTQLEYLILEGCKGLAGGAAQCLSSLTRLKRLQLGSAALANEDLQCLAPLTELEVLDLDSCFDLTDEGLKHLAPLVRLRHLNLSWGSYTDVGMSSLTHLTSLENLILGYCDTFTDAGLSRLASLDALKRLDLRGGKIFSEEALAPFKQRPDFELLAGIVFEEVD